MKLAQLIAWIRDRLHTVVRVCLGLLVLLVLIDAWPGVVNKDEAHTTIERWPAFWAVFGFVGCVLLIVLSKAFGHAGIMKREDYYDD
jgi:uncharacterized membrane protein YozB (DUF420 family)